MATCHNCGRFVTPAFARVFGSNEDEVHLCFDCAPSRELLEAGAAARAES